MNDPRYDTIEQPKAYTLECLTNHLFTNYKNSIHIKVVEEVQGDKGMIEVSGHDTVYNWNVLIDSERTVFCLGDDERCVVEISIDEIMSEKNELATPGAIVQWVQTFKIFK